MQAIYLLLSFSVLFIKAILEPTRELVPFLLYVHREVLTAKCFMKSHLQVAHFAAEQSHRLMELRNEWELCRGSCNGIYEFE